MVDILVIADSLRKRGLKGFVWVLSIFQSRGLMEIERHIQGFSEDYDGTRKSFGDLAWICQGTFVLITNFKEQSLTGLSWLSR